MGPRLRSERNSALIEDRYPHASPPHRRDRPDLWDRVADLSGYVLSRRERLSPDPLAVVGRLPEDQLANVMIPVKEAAVERTDNASFSVNSELAGSVGVIRLSGEIDVAAAPLVREMLGLAVHQGAVDLIVDLTDVSFIDSSGLGTLVGGRNRALEAGGSIRLIATEPAVTRVLTLTRLDGVFPVYDSLELALRSESGTVRTGEEPELTQPTV